VPLYELFDVDVHELAGMSSFAPVRRLGRAEAGEPPELETLEPSGDWT